VYDAAASRDSWLVTAFMHHIANVDGKQAPMLALV
jgi:hypothetical protein